MQMWHKSRTATHTAQTRRMLQEDTVLAEAGENSAFEAHIYAKNAPPRRTYLHRAPTTRILADKSNTMHIGALEAYKCIQENTQAQVVAEREKTGQNSIGNEILQKKEYLGDKKEYFLKKKELQKVKIPISKLRKKNSRYNEQEKGFCAIDGGKKRNLSSTTAQNERIESKNNPHVDINDLPANILDDLSFQHLSLEGEPVATSTPKEKKKNQEQGVSEKALAEVSPLVLPAPRCLGRGQEMQNMVQQGQDLKKPTKERQKTAENKVQTKYISNKLKKGGLLVKRLRKPITCNSSLDDEIITTFS